MDRASGSIAHPSYFDGNNYGAWKAKVKSFLWSLDERVWSTVVHRFPKPTKKIGKGDEETTILKAREEWTTVTHEGTDTVKGAKLQMHTLQFETLMMDENETFSEFYAKLYVVNEEDDGHSNEDCSDEELMILTRQFMNFLKNQDPRSRDSNGINSKNRFVNYTDGYGHISSEYANTLKKQKDDKNKAMHITWSDIRLSFMLLRWIHDKLNLSIAVSLSILPVADLWHN
ncbi:hypothetical protein L3X38_025605 [Prunus dulcis]|uniref:DUF4219 domain-containing protein n=1 Tax=Prunus dulcis TaxID=3755 RepID=A0AAD4W3V7_PRUDU|nr:hypothetical protein L3X38_025605 [Prunus dulcis]